LEKSYYLINPTKRRYYNLIFAKDLFGHWILTKSWGSLDNAKGRIVHEYFEQVENSIQRINHTIKLKLGRGYQTVNN